MRRRKMLLQRIKSSRNTILEEIDVTITIRKSGPGEYIQNRNWTAQGNDFTEDSYTRGKENEEEEEMQF